MAWNIGARVEQLRKERGWAKRELAKRAGVNETHIYKICVGERPNASGETVRRLAKAFHVSTDYLLGMDVEDTAQTAADGTAAVAAVS